MARIDGGPAVWHVLPQAMAAELGWTISSFGHLEDMLKRAIFALDRGQLGGAIREIDFSRWLQRMDHVAADSLGTLIDRLERTLLREGLSDAELVGTLEEIKDWRNLLCHAAWQPAGDGWMPIFVNTKGEEFGRTLAPEDLLAIRDMTLDAAARVRRIVESLDDHGNGTAD